MEKEMSRRELLKLSGIAGASVVGGGLTGYAFGAPAAQGEGSMWPWPLQNKIKVKAAARLAYQNYYVRGCMYGSFTGVVAPVADALGEPYSNFPFEMMHFGAGGGELWGTLCGTLNGGLAALAVFVGDTGLRRQMANQLMAWYEKTAQPVWNPKTPIGPVPVNLPTSKAKSTLCHVSIARWVAKSKLEPFSPERADRCGRLAASVAEFTANLLNEAMIKGNLQSRTEMSKTAGQCLGCHGRGVGPNEPDALSRMDCELCHDAELDRTVFPHK